MNLIIHEETQRKKQKLREQIKRLQEKIELLQNEVAVIQEIYISRMGNLNVMYRLAEQNVNNWFSISYKDHGITSKQMSVLQSYYNYLIQAGIISLDNWQTIAESKTESTLPEIDIRDTYLKLASQLHPDSNSPHSNLEKFKELARAYKEKDVNALISLEASTNSNNQIDIEEKLEITLSQLKQQYVFLAKSNFGRISFLCKRENLSVHEYVEKLYQNSQSSLNVCIKLYERLCQIDCNPNFFYFIREEIQAMLNLTY